MKRKRGEFDNYNLTEDEINYFQLCYANLPENNTDAIISLEPTNEAISGRLFDIYRAAHALKYMRADVKKIIEIAIRNNRKKINLSKINLTISDIQLIEDALKITFITHMYFFKNSFTSTEFLALSKTSIKSLEIHNHDFFFYTLKLSNECFPNLLTLSIVESRLTSKFCSNLNYISTLTNLDLSRNHITTEGALILAQNRNLISVNLSYNLIKDDAALAFMSNYTLRVFKFNCNYVTDMTALAFSNHPSIIHLEMEGNFIQLRGIKALTSNTRLIVLKAETWPDIYNAKKYLGQTDPLKRANFGREVELQTEVPSLLRLSLFQVKKSFRKDFYMKKIPNDLRELASRKRI